MGNLSKVEYPLVPAERDPALVRHMPFFSKRRKRVLERLETTVGGSYKRKNTPYFQTVNLKRAVEEMSTRTLEIALDHFGGEHQPIMIRFFICAEQYFPSVHSKRPDEMLVRAVLSYRDAFEKVIPDDRAKYLFTSPEAAGIDAREVFRMAKSSHGEFLSYEDLSAMDGDVRVRFEAMLMILAFNMFETEEQAYISNRMTEVIIGHADRVDDILQYQRDRSLTLRTMEEDALREYLDTPSPSLGSGML